VYVEHSENRTVLVLERATFLSSVAKYITGLRSSLTNVEEVAIA
jgi:hypothetical protein